MRVDLLLIQITVCDRSINMRSCYASSASCDYCTTPGANTRKKAHGRKWRWRHSPVKNFFGGPNWCPHIYTQKLSPIRTTFCRTQLSLSSLSSFIISIISMVSIISVAEWSECRTRNPAVPDSSPAPATWICFSVALSSNPRQRL